jgi:hypothetical protein
MSKNLKNILIIAYDWPPRNVISTHRVYSFAKYWSKMGHTITVLTAKKKFFDRPLDLSLPRLRNVKVINLDYKSYVSYFNFLIIFHNLLRKIKYFFSRNLNLQFNLKSNWLISAKTYIQNKKLNFDIIVSSFGPAECHLIAYEIKNKNKNTFWVADYRDFWSQHTNNNKEKQSEKKYVGENANLVTCVSEYLKKKIHLFLNIESIKIYNGYDFDKYEIKKRLFTKKKIEIIPLRIVYTGTLFEHRDPTPLFEAIFRLYEKKYINYGEIVVEFFGERLFLLDEILKKNPRYKFFVKRHESVGYKKSLSLQKNAGLLLLLESSISYKMGNLTGKLFEYMVSGRPILLIGCQHKSEISQIVRKTGVGISFSPKENYKLEGFIKKIVTKKKINFYRPKLENIIKYSRKSQSEKMLSEINKAIIKLKSN